MYAAFATTLNSTTIDKVDIYGIYGDVDDDCVVNVSKTSVGTTQVSQINKYKNVFYNNNISDHTSTFMLFVIDYKKKLFMNHVANNTLKWVCRAERMAWQRFM